MPVLIFEAETDVTLLQYALARQDDAEYIRTWEVAGVPTQTHTHYRTLTVTS